ncbi:MAG TPA: hypothetical protein VL992_00595 [Tepidisphaeraceae bacterium]|nr:hypothetical protein [Tepidisphaeraceae bacterium]
MELQQAIAQIADIRLQMSRTRQFRGLGAAATLATAIAAGVAAVWQAERIPDPLNRPQQFVLLWVSVAGLCVAISAIEVLRRYRADDSPLQHELTRHAVEQFLPSLIVGGLLTLVICQDAPAAIWMLPGLWQIIIALGLFASRQLFPMPIFFVGSFYAVCGLINLTGVVPHLSPWSMAVPFGVGQLANSAVLYFSLERRHAASNE